MNMTAVERAQRVLDTTPHKGKDYADLIDLVTDLFLWSTAHGHELDDVIDDARRHHDAEARDDYEQGDL
jgi:hypothetical protein